MEVKFIQEMKKVLEKEATRLEKDLGSFAKKNIHNKNDYQSSFPDFGDESDENAKEVALFGDRLAIERTLEKELRDIKAALKRIAAGNYGICKYCQQDIAPARLRARPTSTSCVKCKKELKGEG